ncbi:leucine-rich repeat-containing protein let-4-like isoform X2 [Anopheles merus]|uniref:leucine-rich repeat-containing protein let-4-like isoform X2 n=1 Tax=Anopheles merus TaxID=30066 RepID=UPI001BE466A6|nr:leucine-rich repeat-containing protein let-4-like isoform X2 [Anopheles merus]
MKLFIVFLLVYSCIRSTTSDESKCSTEYRDACTLNTFTIGNDSWIDQLQTVTSIGKPKTTIIKRCLLTDPVAVQNVMELASKLFTELSVQSYHEQALSLTPRLAIETLELLSAPPLKRLTILPNPHLRSLYIVNSAVRHIPETIVNLSNLQFLGIEKSFLRLLDLSVLCYLPRLTTLQVLRNHISLLLPVHESSCVSSLRDLHLDYNQLTTLDIAVLAPFTALQRLLLQHNRMHSLFASQPTSFPLLQELQLGPGNNFTWIEFEQLNLPETLTANLPGNQFQQLPTIRSANLPNLQRIYLDGNQLSTIDLAQLQEHQQLNGVDFSRNRLHTVTASELTHLPNLTSIELVDNMLESFSLANCTFPQLNYLYLKGNRLQFVPAEVYTSELSPTFMLNLEKNPLRCASVQRYSNLISITTINPPLIVTIARKCATMNYNGSMSLNKWNSACCINAP